MAKKRTPDCTLRLRHADGSLQTFTHRRPDEADAVVITPIRPVAQGGTENCPICLVARATEREHVPPQALGGRRLTWTCEPCNNRLGTRLEEDLADWWDGTFRMRFSSEAIPGGKRRFARTRVMPTDDDGFVILADDPTHRTADAWAVAMANGGADVEFVFHSGNRAKLALLKTMYLTACLDMGAPPAGVVADQVRHDLIAARDAPSRDTVPRSELALGLRFARSHDGPQGPDVSAAIAVAESADGPRWGALLARTLFVEFPPGFPVAGINEAAA